MPDAKIKAYWNFIIIFLLIYTASFVPYRIAFIDDNPMGMVYADSIMDLIFLTDLMLNFFTPYEDKKQGLEIRHKHIAFYYLKTWFIFDILSW